MTNKFPNTIEQTPPLEIKHSDVPKPAFATPSLAALREWRANLERATAPSGAGGHRLIELLLENAREMRGACVDGSEAADELDAIVSSLSNHAKEN